MIVDCAVYRDGTRLPGCHAGTAAAELRALADAPGDVVWIGLFEPTAEEWRTVADTFALSAGVRAEAQRTHQRPRLDLMGEVTVVVLKTLRYHEDLVETGELRLVIGPDFVITIRHGEGGELRHARARVENRPEVLRGGTGAVLHTVIEAVVTEYEAVVSELETDVDEVEESVFSPERTRDSARIYVLKREIAEVRRAVVPLREPLRRLDAGELMDVSDALRPLVAETTGRVGHLAELVESLDQLLSTAFQAHQAAISIRQNDDMRRISAGAALVVVPTLIAGVYGMNFENMPELSWTYGYPFALGLMVGIAGALWWVFKRSGWL
ncbi:magnesium and cobalt transport protein CorA [Nocardioides sp.]|uniref:magnesium and cobalt transport protein CorA n=1 Tax=Nocardioides sp. TaxID=35761 RepID=UPI003514D9BF